MEPDKNKVKAAILLQSIKLIAKRKNIRPQDIVKATAVSPSNMSKYIHSKQVPQLDTFLRLVHAVGYELTMFEAGSTNEDIEKVINDATDKIIIELKKNR